MKKKFSKPRKNFKKAEEHRREVPSDIILNILSRLPLKSCIKCKVVCKDWYHLIKSPEFANLRSSQQGRYHYLTIMPKNKRRQFRLLQIDRSSKIDETGDLIFSNDAMITAPTLFEFQKSGTLLVNECNGLSLLTSWAFWQTPNGNCFIFNHVTGELVATIYPYETFRPPFHVDCFGLGCCPISEQFKILSILTNNEARIRTLGSNEWRTIENAPASYPRGIFVNTAFLHGSLHRYSDQENVIWCFNFETERFWQILVPDGFEAYSSQAYHYRCVSVFNFGLCLTTFPHRGQKEVCEIWVMKEYGVKDSWVKQFVVQAHPNSLADVPLFEMDSGKILFTSSGFTNLRSYDIKSKKWKKVKIPGISSYGVNVIHHANINIMFSKLQ